MKIAVSGGKGGTGKTMVATSLAVLFAERSRTILVDADVECPNDHIILSIKRKLHSRVEQPIPVWDTSKCNKCGRCSQVCKQNAIVCVKGRYPAFVKDVCIGCKACMVACPYGAISEGRKEIGSIYTGSNHGVGLVSGELKLGELASGEIVTEVRKRSEEIGSEITVIDSAAGVGCPVIASMAGTDYVVCVTEPTPSGLHDLKRVLFLARHFRIRHGIVLNKHDLSPGFARRIEAFAKDIHVPVLAKVPYSNDFLDFSMKKKLAVESGMYRDTFNGILSAIMQASDAD